MFRFCANIEKDPIVPAISPEKGGPSCKPEQKKKKILQNVSVLNRLRCPGSGVFQCTVTGLVFVMTQKAELQYKTVQWDESLLQPARKTPAGPLFDIKCDEDAVWQLHLPHCETKEGK